MATPSDLEMRSAKFGVPHNSGGALAELEYLKAM